MTEPALRLMCDRTGPPAGCRVAASVVFVLGIVLVLMLRSFVEFAPLRWAVGVTGGVLMLLSLEIERRARVAAGDRSTWRGAWYPMIAGWLLMFSAEWWSPEDARLFWGLLGAGLVLLLVGLQRQRL